jgi:protein-S-isoprenylcysteine O-methyltransferase Ste14
VSPQNLLYFVRAVALGVWVYHLVGAARTFSPVKGEHPSPSMQVFGIAIFVLTYRLFTARLQTQLVIPGLLCFACSIVLFGWARRSVRGKFFSYIYSNDTPEFLCTSGPFAYIRNPFYTSYLLSYVGAAMMFPGMLAYVVVIVMFFFFWRATRLEERKFARSPLAADYSRYRLRTGRFIPRVRR